MIVTKVTVCSEERKEECVFIWAHSFANCLQLYLIQSIVNSKYLWSFCTSCGNKGLLPCLSSDVPLRRCLMDRQSSTGPRDKVKTNKDVCGERAKTFTLCKTKSRDTQDQLWFVEISNPLLSLLGNVSGLNTFPITLCPSWEGFFRLQHYFLSAMSPWLLQQTSSLIMQLP